jgi:multiple sugar transport system ATP-binding protein
MDSNEIALKVSGVNKSYGKLHVLKDLELTVRDKEFLVLLGPSGCGKTTLLRIISGLVELDTGSVFIRGKDVTHELPHKRDIGLVFQDYALFPHMTVAKNIAFGLRMRHIHKSEIEPKIEEALRFVRLEGLGQRGISQLSGGQQQRVALARAIVLRPSLLLLDEPLSNLDAKLRVSVRVEIAQLQKSLGLTSILVTHDQVEAMTMADRIVLMNDGIIQQSDDPIKVYERPNNIFTASFIGSPSINMFNIEIKSGKVYFDDISESRPVEAVAHALRLKQPSQPIPSGKYVLGIRPEDFDIQGEKGKDCLFNADVVYVETLGSDTYLHLNLAGKTLVVRSPTVETTVKRNDVIGINFCPKRAHLFDAESQNRATFTD